MNHLIKLLYIALFFIFIACESNNDNNDNDVIITADINKSPLLDRLKNEQKS